MNEKTPEFCDYDCPFADFPPAETAGICRTMAAIWCQCLNELVNKNAACEHRKRAGRSAKPASARKPRNRARKRG